MKLLLGLLMFLSLESFAGQKNTYSAYSYNAVAGTCNNSDFRALFLENIISAANNAKSACENKSGKLCGVTSMKSQYISDKNYCVGFATAAPLEK